MGVEALYKNYKDPFRRKHVFFDIETTGLFPRRGDRIIEIGAVAFLDGTLEQEFSSMMNAQKRITKAAQQVHGISNEELQNAPEPETVCRNFNDFITGSTLIAHNAAFDMSFLRYEFQRHRLCLNNKTLCTLQMSKRQFPTLPNHKLETVYQHIVGDKQIKQKHRALDDARMVAAIWMAMEGK